MAPDATVIVASALGSTSSTPCAAPPVDPTVRLPPSPMPPPMPPEPPVAVPAVPDAPAAPDLLDVPVEVIPPLDPHAATVTATTTTTPSATTQRERERR